MQLSGRILSLVLACCLVHVAATDQKPNPNLAATAEAKASETQSDDFGPQKGIDGDEGTRWSGIPGHNSGVWYELDWKEPVTLAQLVVHQYDRYTMEWDIQTWDEAKHEWINAGHYGKAGAKLPLVVVCPISPVRTTKVRIANITNGPSFTEVEAFSAANVKPNTIELASDLQGNFVGMLCDGYGSAPMADKEVTVKASGWTARTKSDEHGMFWVPMPTTLKGTVTAESIGSDTRSLQAADFQRAITPISDDIHPLELATDWKFCLNPAKGFEAPNFDDKHWPDIKVPAHWTMEGFKGDTAGYRRTFAAPAGQGRLMLRFDGVYSGSKVWVNGRHLASHEGGFTPFEMDVTDVVHAGPNVIAVQVEEHTNVSDNLDKMSQYADFALAGIIRKVTLFRVPDTHVEAYEATTDFAPDAKTATLSGRIKTLSLNPLTATVFLADASGQAISSNPFPINNGQMPGTGQGQFSLNVAKPKAWSAEHPNLYTLTIQLSTGQVLKQTIGLRQTDIRGTEILINKSPVKFRGTCHHDQYPTMGRAVTPAIEEQDMRMIKDANLNSVRTSHYPPMPELIADADRLGLYVEDEADFCWVGVSDDLRNTPRIIQLEGELLARDRNHPSVFIWSLCNESTFGYGFERAHEFVRKTDPSRPNSAAISEWLEVATEHNPISSARMIQDAPVDKPILWDESWCIFQGIWNDVDEMWVDPGIRDYYVEPLIQVYRDYMASKNVAGSMIWAWSDDLFCVPGINSEYGRSHTQSHFIDDQYSMPNRGITGDAPWGVVDGWRRPKPEFWITKKLQSPIKVDEKQTPKIVKEGLRIPVTNQFDFTNLNELNITWASGNDHGTATANVAPRSEGFVDIKGPALGADPVTVAFRDKSGRLIDKFRLHGTFENSRTWPHSLTPIAIHDAGMLAGNATYLTGEGFELGFESGSGWLRRAVTGDMSVMLDSPYLHVLDGSSPTAPTPNRRDWHPADFTIKRADRNLEIVQTGTYSDFKGSYRWTIAPEGEITIHANFTYTGKPIFAREIGLTLTLPKGCTELGWDRNAEWAVYPPNEIGRPIGTAQAFYDHGTEVPPTWPWSRDNSPMGSNDFRSTKRHINTARIGYPQGSSVEIESDGTQSVRAMVASDRIELNVLDWYGGTNVGLGEWLSNYGRGKSLKAGDVIESTVKFIFHPRLRPVAAGHP